MNSDLSDVLKYSDEVAAALASGSPIVALESTIISHGLPRPTNLDVAREVEAIVREHGATPATIAVIDGSVHILAIAVAFGKSAATTVAATAHLAVMAGIKVFATGGLGGVHRGAQESFDESADLTALSALDITVVCAGVKSILDVGATLERLETLAIGVIGYKTKKFPGFYLTDSGFEIEYQADSADQIAAAIKARTSMKTNSSALIVANPVKNQMDKKLHDSILASGLALAEKDEITGKAVTPFLLEHFHTASDGDSLRVNIEIIKSNCALAADIAVALNK